MKTLNKVFMATGLGLSLVASSCTGDLDLMPTDPNQITYSTFAEDPAGYMERSLADIYLNFVTTGPNNNSVITKFDGGMSVFQRALFNLQEVPTDEANWLYSFNDVNFGELQYGIFTTDNVCIGGTYSRLLINITLCNDFIRTVNEGYFNVEGDATLKAKADEYVRQAKVLRAAAYYYFIDLFGNVPYADENTQMNTVPEQLTRAEVYNKVVTELEAVAASYNNRNDASYGFVGLDVAESILVKFYLNAEVYKGQAEWQKCANMAERIIARHQGGGFQASDGTFTGLCNNYFNNFSYNNFNYANGSGSDQSEILWILPASNLTPSHLKTYGGATIMLNAMAGSPAPASGASMNYKDRYNTDNGWSCVSARRQFSEVFNWNGDFTYVEDGDVRVDYWATGADGFSIDNPNLLGTSYGSNGFAPIKYTNWWLNEDGTVDAAKSPAAPKDEGVTAYAMVRLAEIYLSAAEAYLHQGNVTKAAQYTNFIRERAGLVAWNDSEMTMDNLRDERQRELYTEGTRRTDLIRYGKWTSGYNWNWKSKVAKGADMPAYYNLYPIPSSIQGPAGYTQNPGY